MDEEHLNNAMVVSVGLTALLVFLDDGLRIVNSPAFSILKVSVTTISTLVSFMRWHSSKPFVLEFNADTWTESKIGNDVQCVIEIPRKRHKKGRVPQANPMIREGDQFVACLMYRCVDDQGNLKLIAGARYVGRVEITM